MLDDKAQEILIITGATAVGKTSLALSLAERVGAEIVSADSLQVYRGMDIGSAKPSPAELARVPHHGIDISDPDQPFDLGKFLDLTRHTLSDIKQRGKRAIIVGGTGFYLNALCRDFVPALAPSAEVKQRVLNLIASQPEAAWSQLAKVDPVSFERIEKNDLYRLGRALEIWEATGQTMSQVSSRSAPADSPFVLVSLQMEKDVLQKHIETRVAAMFRAGLLAEVEGLLAKGYDKNLAALRAIGYKETIEFIEGGRKISEAALGEKIVIHTRQLAKRQRTWFRQFKRDWPADKFYELNVDGGISDDEILKIPGLRQRLHYY